MALPIEAVLQEIAAHLAAGPNLVVIAPPGAGKTTRVGPMLLDSGLVGRGQTVLMLQPRRIAARAAARRIAAERGGAVGGEVGYQVRFDDRTSSATRLAVLTEGLLARRLQGDPFLENVAAVLLDEFHERSIHTDLAVAFLREIQETVRPELKIVVMSATLDAGPVARFLGSCPVVEARGREHPVQARWLDAADDRPLTAQVVSAVLSALEDPAGGDLLVFLPGAPEIRLALRELERIAGRARVIPLYGDLPPEEQDLALAPCDRRKVILATNIAQTSLTIEGIGTVIDTGYAKVVRHDPARGMNRLDRVRISLASAAQRAGRAGRTGPGRAFKLWTRAAEPLMPEFDEPEIRRIDLAPAVLEVIGFAGRDPRAFGWFEPPPRVGLDRALALLSTLGALEAGSTRLTRRGEHLRALPLAPRLGAVLIAAHGRGAVRAGALAAALASERDPARRVQARGERLGPSDLLDRADLLDSDGPGELDSNAARNVRQAARQLADLARRVLGPTGPALADDDESVRRALLAGFPDRVCLRRAAGSDRALMVGGRGVRLAAESVVRAAPLFVAVEVEDAPHGSESLVRIASAIEPGWLSDVGEVVADRSVRFDGRAAVEAVARRRFADLVLEERPDPDPDRGEIARVLLEAVLADPAAALAPDDALGSLLDRLALLRRAMPELGLPDPMGASLADWLAPLCEGRRSFAELRKAGLVAAVAAWLGRRTVELVDREAPERITVPSGSRIRLRYEADGPVLAVRLQEVFGLARTPRVAAGRVAVKMELLGPSMRPVQITQDLESFWTTTYPQVRKDLRARYPRHAWPEDPRTEPPRRRPSRGRSGP